MASDGEGSQKSSIPGKVWSLPGQVREFVSVENVELLRTPAASDGEHSGPNQRDSSGHPSLTMQLLRTPAASEAERGHQPEEKAKARGGQVTLSGQINFLPTPTVGNHNESGHCRDWGGDLTHSLTCYCNKFGRFEPAIRRWEQITSNKAPEPTKPDGKDGNPRLSSEFTEWMMGLEPGWITSVGLSRKDELKACGNGVVPQQAMLALKM